MNRRGHAGRTDANHTDIVKALLNAGCSVQSLATVGLGCPDLVVGFAGLNILIEAKNGANPPSERKLNDAEKTWHKRWKGQVTTVYSPEQAVDAVKRAIMSLGAEGIPLVVDFAATKRVADAP